MKLKKRTMAPTIQMPSTPSARGAAEVMASAPGAHAEAVDSAEEMVHTAVAVVVAMASSSVAAVARGEAVSSTTGSKPLRIIVEIQNKRLWSLSLMMTRCASTRLSLLMFKSS